MSIVIDHITNSNSDLSRRSSMVTQSIAVDLFDQLK